MSYMHAASTGFAEARAIYEAGYKSANKLHVNAGSVYANGSFFPDLPMGAHETDREIDPAYAGRFGSAGGQLRGLRRQLRIPQDGNFLRNGKAMLRMRPVAANCGELAMMAAASAWARLGSPQPAPVALVSLQAPADHVFCLVGNHNHCGDVMLDCDSIHDLTTDSPDDDMWVADPWLNVMCRLKNYPAQAAAKFNKWQAANKRIGWGTGPQGAGWYPPVGDYSTGFDAAGLNVILG